MARGRAMHAAPHGDRHRVRSRSQSPSGRRRRGPGSRAGVANTTRSRPWLSSLHSDGAQRCAPFGFALFGFALFGCAQGEQGKQGQAYKRDSARSSSRWWPSSSFRRDSRVLRIPASVVTRKARS